MRTVKVLCLSLLAAAGALIAPRAAETSRDINPALLYFKAFLLAPPLSESEREQIFSTHWRGRLLDSKVAALLTNYDNTFATLRKAAKSSAHCDWGFDPSEGPEALLPGLAKAKGLAEVARLRARWRLQNGKESEAREELLAAFALARQTASDGVLISAMVQIAMENSLANFVAENFFAFGNEGLAALARGLREIPPRNTVAQCLPVEKAAFADWFLLKVETIRAAHPGEDSKAMDEIRELYARSFSDAESPDKDAGFADRWFKAAGGTSVGIAASLQAMTPYYGELQRILALPHGQIGPAIKAFESKVASDPNPIGAKFLPVYSKCEGKEIGIRVKLAMVEAAIQYRLNGAEGLRSMVDPAGTGPFAMERFALKGEARGFALKSKLNWRGFDETLIFVEKDGPIFHLDGPKAGQIVDEKE